MISKTHKIRRITVAIALAASLAAWAAQPALPFDGRSPDTREAAEQPKLSVVVDGRSPDTRDASERTSVSSGIAVVDALSPDTREAAEQAKPSSGVLVVDLRSPDTRAAAEQAKPSSPVSIADARSPDTRDTAFRALLETRVVPPDLVSADRFHWDDFGIGVSVALGSMLLLAGLAASALAARQRRSERTGTATA
jgi:hypothetical protein